jgi:hypothetical protein
LNCLFNLLAKYFLNLHFAPEDFEMTTADIFLSALILHRKFILSKDFYPYKEDYQISIEQLIHLIEVSKTTTSQKRPEENTKFIYKLTVKRFKDQYKDKNPTSKDSDDSFYRHYFAELAPDQNFSRFKDPLLNLKDKQKGQPKTISQKYLKIIFESPSFKADFIEYLSSSEIIIDYQKAIQKKLQKCLVGLETRFSLNEKSLPATMLKVNEYILKNKFFKLPWTVIEINQAISYFQNLVKSFDSKKK